MMLQRIHSREHQRGFLSHRHPLVAQPLSQAALEVQNQYAGHTAQQYRINRNQQLGA
jgi:hypothetical protein